MLDPNLKKLIKTVLESCQDTKATDLIGLDMSDIQSYTDFIFVMSATSTTQAQAIAEKIRLRLKKDFNKLPIGVEGYDSPVWILLDFGDVICHIFQEEARSLYRLEHMWPRVTPMTEKELEAALKAKKKAPAKKTKKVTATTKKTAVKKVIKRKTKK